ncbi:MAG TPA: hypothetical protein VFX52_09155 [Nocardioidaceae bacterium]|nr:hypothetical protein [Nocardioidaceae bacterium]
MTENQNEPQLADQARTALLEAITKAAQAGCGEIARNLADAYSILKANAPTEAKGDTVVRPPLAGRR